MPKAIPKVTRFHSLINAKRLFENPLKVINDHFSNMETDSFRTHLGLTVDTLMTQNPVVTQHVLQKNHKNYYKSEIQSKILARFIGKGLLTSNGEYWLKQRRLIQPGFHKRNLESFLKIMNQEIMDYVNQLAARYPNQKNNIDINFEMSMLTMRVVSRALFSSEIDDEEINFIGKAVDQLQVAVTKDIRVPFLSWWRHLKGEERANDKTSKQLYNLLQKKIEKRKKSEKTEGDLLDMLLNVRYEETGTGMTEQQLIDEILVLYAAGYETTANSLAWTFKTLLEHPDVLSQLIEEIDSVSLEGELKMENLFQLPYTSKVISESLRMFPPVWIIDRLALEDDEIEGIHIAKGEIINIYIYGIHHSEKLWKSPEKFNPERFNENREKRTNFSYLPFGGGPRLCIGNQFAKLEISLVLYHLLKKYKLSLDRNQQVIMHPLITLKPKQGIRMILEERNS